MNSVLSKEVSKLWKQLSLGEPGVTTGKTDIELEIHKRLLNIFQVGNFYYYILNLKELELDLISKEVQAVLGYNPEDLDLFTLMDKIHPEDQPWFLSFENKVFEFFTNLSFEQIPNYKVRYDYRLRKSDGQYIRILQQVISLDYDENGHILRTLGVHTDITHLKAKGRPVLSFIGLNGQPSFLDVSAENLLRPTSFLSARERGVLALLADGKGSREIANELCISIETVNTHRKNIIAKTNSLNTPELIKKAAREGWI